MTICEWRLQTMAFAIGNGRFIQYVAALQAAGLRAGSSLLRVLPVG